MAEMVMGGRQCEPSGVILFWHVVQGRYDFAISPQFQQNFGANYPEPVWWKRGSLQRVVD
ncbi:hypothetical protein LB577_31570 [Mesorhizobium sp. B283B1A]|uniref:hypothetical protein n=1 Tax=Mesorhizobium TaxID=68287 RepID=UPI001CD046BD|nr:MULTISPECIES: hypothetical protein [Mesorhizobium]MCA0051446.1 hypothetical protein [Mesorhizobium sp. B283B1A]UQS66486.1 hypothetical protein M5D98_09115 [Mesorhizobium opportunistum]